MRLVGLLGYPLGHSLSPRMHNAAFEAQGLDCRYVALPVRPGELDAAVDGLKALGFLGANVTLPHKRAAWARVDSRSPQAEAVGAVNTLVCRRPDPDGPATLHGDNTDVAGFLAPLAGLDADLGGEDAVVFGGGGAARAVVYAILSTLRPARLTLAVRTPARAEALARDMATHDPRGALRVTALDDAGPAVRSSRLVVNATPLGMHPHTDGTPWTSTGDFGDGQVVYDLVYNPDPTRLMREAAARGAATLGGLEMLIAQAAAAYVQWTGRDMPLDVVRNTLADEA